MSPSEIEALRILGSKPVWRLDALPPAVNESALRRLDVAGCVEVRRWILHNQEKYSGDTTPPAPGPSGGWASPVARREAVGSWVDVCNPANHKAGCSPEVRLTEAGRAALDAAGEAMSPSPPADGATNTPEQAKPTRQKKVEWLAKAMLMRSEEPDPRRLTHSEIARRVGVHKATLTQCPEYRKIAGMDQSRDLPAGTKEVDSATKASMLEAVLPAREEDEDADDRLDRATDWRPDPTVQRNTQHNGKAKKRL
ncbi:MAG: hypothetical protein K8S99_03565 [Planctomycetes bacterium]|nr:hypothetical protein [Planctomycetota bacterium]